MRSQDFSFERDIEFELIRHFGRDQEREESLGSYTFFDDGTVEYETPGNQEFIQEFIRPRLDHMPSFDPDTLPSHNYAFPFIGDGFYYDLYYELAYFQDEINENRHGMHEFYQYFIPISLECRNTEEIRDDEIKLNFNGVTYLGPAIMKKGDVLHFNRRHHDETITRCGWDIRNIDGSPAGLIDDTLQGIRFMTRIGISLWESDPICDELLGFPHYRVSRDFAHPDLVNNSEMVFDGYGSEYILTYYFPFKEWTGGGGTI